MKVKPKAVWVVFIGGKNYVPTKIYKERVVKRPYSSGQSVACYHLHPGNEVKKVRGEPKKVRGELARALNVLEDSHLLRFPDGAASKLRDAGFRVRWDAKKGRFV